MSGHLHPARQYDSETLVDLARLSQNLPWLVRPKRAEAAHPLDLRMLKDRKRLLPSRFNDRLFWWRHARCLRLRSPCDLYLIWTVSRLPEPFDSSRSPPHSSVTRAHKA